MPVATTTVQKISEARAKMMRTSFFWGSLSANLTIVESDKYKTLATDATTLWVNPKWVDKQEPEELVGSCAYETVKCALGHPFRIPGGADMELVNEASSKVAYTAVKEAGYRLPKNAPMPAPDEIGLCFEDLLHLLNAKKQKQKQGQQGKNGKSKKSESESGGSGSANENKPAETGTKPSTDPGKAKSQASSEPGESSSEPELAAGEIVSANKGTDPLDDESKAKEDGEGKSAKPRKMLESDWQIAVQQAMMVAEKAGQLGGNAKMLLDTSKESRTSLREQLKRFLESTKASHVSWNKLNRRLQPLGIYQPSVVKSNMPKIAICIDTSGSVWWAPGLPQKFAQIVSDTVVEMKPERVDVYYADTKVQQIQSFTPDEEIILENIGGGGTLFAPAIRAVMEETEEQNYCCIIYLTDMENETREVLTEPELPILWVAPNWAKRPAPFGELVKLSEVEI